MQNKWGIKEKEIEDWICENPEQAFWLGFEIVGRQIDLRHGILDVLAYDDRIYVIEIKARSIREKDIGQLLRYTHDVREALQEIGINNAPRFYLPDPDFFPHSFPPYFPNTKSKWLHQEYWDRIGFGNNAEEVCHIQPMFVGLTPPENTRAAASAANIICYKWEYNSQSGFFIDKNNCFLPQQHFYSQYPDWLIGLFNKTIKTTFKEMEMQDIPDDFPHIIHN